MQQSLNSRNNEQHDDELVDYPFVVIGPDRSCDDDDDDDDDRPGDDDSANLGFSTVASQNSAGVTITRENFNSGQLPAE